MAYTTYIRPTVKYASPVWDPHTKGNTNKIKMVQRRCARYVTGIFDRTSSVTSLLNCLIWQTLKIDGANTALLWCTAYFTTRWISIGSPFSPKLHLAQGVTAADSLCRFVRIMSMPLLFSLPLVKTAITLPSIQLMHHPLTSLPVSWGMTMPWYLSFFSFFYVMFCPHISATNAVRLSSDFWSCTFLEEEEYHKTTSYISAE